MGNRIIVSTLLLYPCLILSSCQFLLHSKTSKQVQITQEFPNIIEELEKAPPFGDPHSYKEWKKTKVSKLYQSQPPHAK